ncbi:hypothetical protein COOONC_27638 [Cooperia oncophora]
MSVQLPVDPTIVSEERKGFLRKGDDIDVSLGELKRVWKEFQQNKNYKPESYTLVAYEKNEPKNSVLYYLDRQFGPPCDQICHDDFIIISPTRYNDILCMDSTRVRLKARSENDDYIHASWMTMPDNQKYLCTQVSYLFWTWKVLSIREHQNTPRRARAALVLQLTMASKNASLVNQMVNNSFATNARHG